MDSTRAHVVVCRNNRHSNVESFAHGDRIAIVERSAEKQVAFRNHSQRDCVRYVAAKHNIFCVRLAADQVPYLLLKTSRADYNQPCLWETFADETQSFNLQRKIVLRFQPAYCRQHRFMCLKEPLQLR